MKSIIWISVAILGLVGGWLGGLLDHGNMLGGWGILGGIIGSFFGVWAGFKLAKMLLP